jgi:hypothetical protein
VCIHSKCRYAVFVYLLLLYGRFWARSIYMRDKVEDMPFLALDTNDFFSRRVMLPNVLIVG